MNIDDRAIRSLVEESQDLQVDALRASEACTDELRDVGASRAGRPVDQEEIREYELGRRKLIKAGGFGLGVLASSGLLATGWGQRVAALVTAPARQGTPVDIQIFQTASSLENLAVQQYGAALELPFVKENAVITAFAQTTMMQHAEHGAAFKAQTEALGGQRQEATNPKYTQVVADAGVPGDAIALTTLAATLEEVAADTYQANLLLLSDGQKKVLMASVLGVETQHLATLRAVTALLQGGAPQLVAIPTDLAALPAAAGSVAFPAAFEQPQLASPPEEGALQ